MLSTTAAGVQAAALWGSEGPQGRARPGRRPGNTTRRPSRKRLGTFNRKTMLNECSTFLTPIGCNASNISMVYMGHLRDFDVVPL